MSSLCGFNPIFSAGIKKPRTPIVLFTKKLPVAWPTCLILPCSKELGIDRSVANFDVNTDPTGLNGNQLPNDCYPKDQLTPGELLPQDPNSKWSQVNPAGQGGLENQNFLNAGHHVGMNTVGQTLRNANYQLRSEPPNPQVKVSPWQQTTIEPDTNRRPMEIGGCE